MGLILIGRYYEKEKALTILNEMKYYNKQLIPIESEQPRGLIAMINAQEERMHEDYLVEKLLMVKSVLDKQGNDALDKYEEITSPQANEFLDPMRIFFKEENWFQEMIDELSVPMKKEEFYHYLDIYNSFYQIKNNE